MVRKTEEERFGLLLKPEDLDWMTIQSEDEKGGQLKDYAAIGKVGLGAMLHMAYYYDADKISELFGGLGKTECDQLQKLIKRHDGCRKRHDKRLACKRRRKEAMEVDACR